MSTELLYTSASQGLRHGSRGFCTVLTTAGMPINVISKLEAISGYRHLNKGSGRRPGDNPVAYSHQRVHLAGQNASVISRIADYGTDYSGRTNKLAHHITIEPSEMAAAGPAWLMQQRSVFRTEWLGQCETPSSGPTIPRGDQSPRVCSTWKHVAGDAGWGGVVAESVASGSNEPLWIVYPIDCHDQILELIDESVAMLTPAMRWRATFSTFAANIPPDVDCKIRFVPAGTEEARFAASSGKAIDLTRSPSITTASQWVERARGVIRPDLEAPATKLNSMLALDTSQDLEPVQSAWSVEDDQAVAPPPPPGPPSLPPEVLSRGQRSKFRWAVVIAAALLLLLGSTWAVARHLAGLPLLPGNEIAAPSPSPVTPKAEPVREPIRVVPPARPPETLTFPVFYDQKQLLAWALNQPTETSPLPDPIRLRGRLRLPPVSLPSTDDVAASEHEPQLPQSDADEKVSEAAATLVAWGADAQTLTPPAPLRVETTKLSDGAQTLTVERFPYVPDAIAGASVYWSRESGDLIALVNLRWSTESIGVQFDKGDTRAVAAQAAAYREYAWQVSRLAELIDAIRVHTEALPPELQTTASTFLASWLRVDNDARVRVLIRDPTVAFELASKTTELNTKLQAKSAEIDKPLTKPQQAALLKIISVCGRFEQACSELARAHATLKSGLRVEVPELKFLDADGRLLRSVPIQFHFSL